MMWIVKREFTAKQEACGDGPSRGLGAGKTRNIYLPVCTLIAAIILYGCGGSSGNPALEFAVPQSGGTYWSDNGILTVEMPFDANAGSRTLSIQTLNPKKLPRRLREIDAIAAFELGPDRSQFTDPVTLTIDLSRIPAIADEGYRGDVLLWGEQPDGSFELVDGQSVSLNTVFDDVKQVTLTASIDHFSSYAITFDKGTIVKIQNQDFQRVGASVAVSGGLETTAASTVAATNATVKITPGTALSGNMATLDLGAVRATTAQSVQKPATGITCQRAGEGRLFVQSEFTGFTTLGASGQRTKPVTRKIRGHSRVLCVEPSGRANGQIPAIGTAAAQSFVFSVRPVNVTAKVGERFNIDFNIQGANAPFAMNVFDLHPGVATSAIGGASGPLGDTTNWKFTNFGINPAGTNQTFVSFQTTANGGGRFNFKCLKIGVTGLELMLFVPPHNLSLTNMNVEYLTVTITCQNLVEDS